MVKTVRSIAAALLTILLTLTVSARGQGKTAETTVWDKVFTDEQAARGKLSYQSACSDCHMEHLRGDGQAPPLKGEDFAPQWKTVGAFMAAMGSQMPPDKPGGLPFATYCDITAFILQANNYPAGNKELAGSLEELDKILLTPKP